MELTNEDQFKEWFESISNKEVDSGHIQKLRDLQATLQTCLTSSSNKEILYSLMNLDIMKDLVKCTKEKYEECKINDKAPEELLDPIRKVLSEYISASTPIHYLLLWNLLMSLFMKENSLGPSFKNRTGTKEYQDFSDDMIEFLNILSPIDEISQLQELLLNYFSREGESVYKNTKGLTILLYLDQLLNLEISEFEIPKSAMIWKARYHMVHNQLLTSNTWFLQDNSIGLYRNFLETNTIENKNIAACLWIEFSNWLLTFFKYSKAEVALENARELIGIKMSLTGKFGRRRTKYQTFDLPQLVLNVESETVEQFIIPEISPVENIINEDKSETTVGEGEGDSEEPKIAHRDVNLEEENILLEKVKLKEEEKATEISFWDQIYINQFAYNEIKSHANEYDLKYEKLNAYIEKVLEKSQNWLIFSMSLFLRSINEQDKYKTRERSMIQMQTLIDQFRDEEPTLGERFRYVFTNAYPLSWNLKRHLGLAYQSIGWFMSAFELFKELEFYEDAAQWLAVSGKITQSENYINEVIEKYGETPRILCLLGDMKRKDEYYEKAWEISGHKYAKAMRSLGMMKFQRGHLDESIEWLKLALDINKLYPSVWFTLGCAYKIKNLNWNIIYFNKTIRKINYLSRIENKH